MKPPPDLQAVALRYQAEQDRVPVVLAQGRGYRAQKILELAEKNGVHIEEDPALVEVLAALPERGVIPPELYAAVAQLLAVVYRLQREG